MSKATTIIGRFEGEILRGHDLGYAGNRPYKWMRCPVCKKKMRWVLLNRKGKPYGENICQGCSRKRNTKERKRLEKLGQPQGLKLAVQPTSAVTPHELGLAVMEGYRSMKDKVVALENALTERDTKIAELEKEVAELQLVTDMIATTGEQDSFQSQVAEVISDRH